MPAIEITGDRFDQDWKRGEAPQATRLPQREDALHPAIALLVVGPLHELAPEHGEPQGPLRSIIRGVDSSFHHKRPQGPQLPLQGAGERPRRILPVSMLAQQMDQPCIPGLYGASGRRRLGPVDQPLQLRQHPAPKPGQLGSLSAPPAPVPGESDGPDRSGGRAPIDSTRHSHR